MLIFNPFASLSQESLETQLTFTAVMVVSEILMAGGCESEHPSACLISIGCFVGNNCTNNRKGLYYWLFKFIDVCVQQYSDQVAY